MPVYPKAGISIVADSSDFDAAYRTVLKEAGNLDSLAPTVKVSVTDSDLKAAVGLAADLNTSTSLKVNVDSSEIETANDALNDIATIGAIDLAINLAGNAKGFVEGLGRFSGLGGLMEMDNALAMIEARTGKMIPNAEKLINDLYVNGWGESKTQIAEVVAQASQLGLEGDALAAAVETTLQVVAVTGGDATETLNKLDTAAKANNLSFTDMADLFVTGFQNGGDRADDLLDTLNEYGTTFSNFRLSAEGAMAFLDSGLALGVYNSDVLADTIREIGLRIAAIGTDEGITAAFEELDALSDVDLSALIDGYKAGTVTGDEMLQGIVDSLADVAAVDPSKATVLAERVGGTQIEDMGISVFTKLSTDADTAFGDIEGRAETAGNTISDTLGVTVDTFLRNIEQMATSFLSSDAIDLDGKIETFKTQLQTALSTLGEGGSLGAALEIGFGIEGVDTALLNVERVFGDLIIALLEVVAFIQDPLGTSDADKGTRAQIAKRGEEQLSFSLKVANADEFQTLIDTAVGRGVSQEKLSESVRTALDELVAEGNFSQVVDLVSEIIGSEGMTPENIQLFTDKYITPLGTAFDDAIASGDFDLAKKISDAQGDPTAYTDALKGKFGFDAATFDQMAADFTAGMETAIAAETPTPDMAWASLWKVPEEVNTSFTGLETDVDTAMTNASLVTGLASQEMIDAMSAITDGVTTADEQIAMAITGNTMTASFDAMSVSADLNAEATKASFMGVLATVSSVDARLSLFFNGVMAKVGAVNDAINGIGTVPPAGGGSTTNNNIVVNTNNNVQSGAQATALGYELGAQVRGMV